ncbi:hypothetical protein [Pseudobacteriovorax antillogorgiicola]|uniref:Uncharacterized protein n=1 Tax=Pseudobacteriovorax antillogorgiicola TaxID=1513793 RepID=A0A1Y6BB43_9BACT|nr:hypothetical protein [Pseudobacteriovorax antillogorgiicola]TCS57347.1 hypothetical protein EDD56_10387 [Pseudobacteriovorax antillogorgiicola]SMF02166.1 hypothetical protein SAMN06296036_103246 [Pseudobacteriovorax antillogorgiicola]
MEFILNPMKVIRKYQSQTFNIIYFVSKGKIRSFTASGSFLVLSVIALVLSILWLLSSSLIITSLHSKVGELQDDLQYSRETLFNLQARYEHVFDRSYQRQSIDKTEPELPATLEGLLSAIPDTGPRTNHGPQDNADPNTDLIEPSNPMKPAGQKASEPAVASNQAKLQKKPARESLVKLQANLSSTDSLKVSYRVINQSPPKVQRGFVGMVSSWVNAEGVSQYLSYPPQIDIHHEGNSLLPKHPAKGLSFKIRRFKKDMIEIPTEAIKGLTLKQVMIYLADTKGQILHMIPLNPKTISH